jgi:large repetitive protein
MSVLLLLSLVSPVHAKSAGKTGNSTTGCSCHGATATATTTTSFSGSATVEPGEVVSMLFVVATTSGSRTHSGLDVSATGGTLAAGSNTQVSLGEITHVAPTAMTSGSTEFSFSWTAPAAEGSYTLRGAGLAADNDGKDSGDGWNLATNFVILVDDGCDDLDGDGYEACDDGTGDDCDDADATVSPGADEYCNGTDDDCDGDVDVDESSAVDAPTWYRDADSDGYGSAASFVVSCDLPAGYTADGSDCDDADASILPGAAELCNGTDDDCDGLIDPDSSVDALTWYQDADGDGYAGTTTTTACSQPSGYEASASDCDDTRSTVHPGASERCNGTDDDCDGSTDEASVDATTWYADSDGDGYGVDSSTDTQCSLPAGYAALSGDCDDADAAYHPGATETCTDTEDFNCDGSLSTADVDGDGYAACEECDDRDATISPAATEVCNGVDDDCDGTVDEADASDAATWYADTDGDGFGDAASSSVSCNAPAGSVADASDCDDGDASAYPGAPETCDGDDDDCDGTVDNDAREASAWYADDDEDGYGTALTSVRSCDAPAGYVADDEDCDDANADTHPGANEVCNGDDDDCDGTTDEADASDATFWYADTDEDGFGDPLAGSIACGAPEGSVADASDCDDGDPDVHPGAIEVWYDGVDQDCDENDADADGDGWESPRDCNDADPAIFPGAEDVPYDGVDADCAKDSDYDADGDGTDSETYGGTDCDDSDAAVFPGAPGEAEDGTSNDCDVRNDHDRDDDGYDDEALGGNDCNDADATVNPGAEDTWYDGEDTDCDGSDDYDQDHDGVPVDEDCDDTDRSVVTPCLGEDTATGGDPSTDAGPDNEACAGCASGHGAATGAVLLAGVVALRRRRP